MLENVRTQRNLVVPVVHWSGRVNFETQLSLRGGARAGSKCTRQRVPLPFRCNRSCRFIEMQRITENISAGTKTHPKRAYVFAVSNMLGAVDSGRSAVL